MYQKVLLILSIVSSVLVLFYKIFKWKIIDLVTPFLIISIWLIVFGFFILITVQTIIILFKNKEWKPVTIQLTTILLLVFFPFTQIMLNIDFKINKSEREKIIQMVEKGTVKPNVSHNSALIHLQKKYQHLSKGGGEIVVEQKGKDYSVLFFTFRGILDNFSGFVYAPNDQKPLIDDFGGDFKEIKKIDENWYWVASY